ncbi:MAG: DUF6629 family protein [Rhodomicrobium sp.]
MCFSATASFSAAAITATIGVATLKQVRNWREFPLASMPLLFAVQQAIEGVLWLQLSAGSGREAVACLSLGFLIFAKVLWPAYIALAVLPVEPDPRRRQALYAIAIFGCSLSIYVLSRLIGSPVPAAIRGHSIAYGGEEYVLTWQGLIYLLCTTVPLLLSSNRAVQNFGAAILVSFVVTAYTYFATFTSVWCFFAAANSSLLYFYFKRTAFGTSFQS